jgi:hypothetical protein
VKECLGACAEAGQFDPVVPEAPHEAEREAVFGPMPML